MKPLYNLTIAVMLLAGCSEKEQVHQAASQKTESEDQLNISILLDLSDRIRENNEKDQELILSVADFFKKHIEKKNLFFIHDQIKVIFYPEPQNDKINTIAESLKIKLDPSNREKIKDAWANISSRYSSQVELLYKYAEEEGQNNKYPGSDIWRFFADKVYDYCIENKSDYRNILIIFTDGYLYHKESMTREKNRSTYLTGPYLSQEGFRNDPLWTKKLEDQDFGFIVKRNDLKNLEILVLEINPYPAHRDDEEIIKKFWSKWFDEMGVKKYKIYSTDLPSNTKELVKIFLSTKPGENL
jgi:hypothetical protein